MLEKDCFKYLETKSEITANAQFFTHHMSQEYYLKSIVEEWLKELWFAVQLMTY